MKDNVDLQAENSRLVSTVQELKLEIAYHIGETKRLLCERDSFKRDVAKMASLFKGWLIDLQSSSKRCLLDNQEFFKNLVKNPSQNISDIMQINDLKLLVTSCQAPYYIEVFKICYTHGSCELNQNDFWIIIYQSYVSISISFLF
jgi:predicted nucleic-acid-binding Zn-ribbon protein